MDSITLTFHWASGPVMQTYQISARTVPEIQRMVERIRQRVLAHALN